MTDPKNEMLEDIFAQARSVASTPSDDLMARVLAAAVPPTPQLPQANAPGLWPRLLDMLGGWPAVSGLAAATVAGVWIGVAPPASVEDFTASMMGDAVSVSLFSEELAFETGEFVDG
jgi:hypothetical protein